MKIKNLKIENFRIFKGIYEFNFENKDLIVIYGNNGNGKSTLFDSIEWAMTGELLRYKGTNERGKFNYIFNSKIYEQQQGNVSVEITFQDYNNEEIIIKRCWFKNNENIRKEININGNRYNETDGSKLIRSILAKDVQDEWVNDKGKFRDMFSASQLLSQDEISDFVSSKNPADRLLVIEKILGVDRYGEDFRKFIKNELVLSEKESELLNKEKDELENNYKNLIYKIESEKNKLEFIEKQYKNIGDKNEKEIIEQLKLLRDRSAGIEIINVINNYESINKETQEELIKYIQYIEKKLSKNKKIQENLLLFSNKNQYKNELEQFKKTYISENIKLKNIIEKREISKNKYELKIKELRDINKVKDELEKYKNKISGDIKLRDELYIQTNYIEKLDEVCKVKEKYKTFDEFTHLYRGYEKELEEINDQKDLIEKKEEINKLSEENEKYKSEILYNENELSKINSEIESIDKIINKYSSSMEYEENTVNQVLYELQNQIINNKFSFTACPVCGQDYEEVIYLKERVLNQLNKSKEHLTDLQNITRQSRAEKTDKIRKQNHYVKIITSVREKSKENLKLMQEKIIFLKSYKFDIKEEALDKTKKELLERQEKIKEFIEDGAFAYRLIKKIYDLEKEIELVNKRIKETTLIIEEIKNDTNIKSDLWEKSKENIEKRIEKYSQFVSLCIKNSNVKKSEINSNIEKIDWYEKELVKLSLMKKNIEELMSISVDEQAISAHLEKSGKLVVILEKLYNDYKMVNNDINIILNRNERNTLVDSINSLNDNKKVLEMKIENKEENIQYLVENNIGLKKIFDESKSIQSNLVSDLIKDYSDYIDKLFYQISPHSYAKHIYLIPRKGELFIILCDKKGRRGELLELSDDELRSEANASLTLSSAQKNILGICIFIAFSNSQSWTKFDMLGIDDPFQNMDDINVYSFLDTLSVMLSKKQIMISTHNEDFAYLISNKSSLDSKRIKLIRLQAYSEERVKYTQN